MEDLQRIKDACMEQQVDFVIWIEQPENIPTALAIKPCENKQLKFMKSMDLKLFE